MTHLQLLGHNLVHTSHLGAQQHQELDARQLVEALGDGTLCRHRSELWILLQVGDVDVLSLQTIATKAMSRES